MLYAVAMRTFVAIVFALTLIRVVFAQVPVQDIQPPGAAFRPAVMGSTGGVSTGHPLTTAAAFSVLLKGGNAFDAGVASLLAGGALEQDLYSLGGEALVLVYPKKEGKVTSVVGQGWAPAAVNVEWYRSRNKTLTGSGLDPAVVPGAIHAALTVLERWGTMSFEDVATPAIDYAEKGFPMRESTASAIRNQLKFFEKWPDIRSIGSNPTIRCTSLAKPSSCRPWRERCGEWSKPNAPQNRTDEPPEFRRRAPSFIKAISRARWWRS